VDALRLAAGIRDVSDVSKRTIAQAEVRTAEAIAHRELGDSAISLPLLVELSTERIEATPHCQLLAQLELVRVHIDANDHDEASRLFDMAAELVELDMPGPGARTWLAAAGTELALSTGDVDGARAWSAQARDSFWSPICAARVLLATDEADKAAVALTEAEPRCLRHQVLLDALQFQASGTPDEADQHLFAAVRLAAGHGIIQTLASQGRGVVEAIEKLAWQAEPAWLDRLRRAGQPENLSFRVDRAIGPVEALTERELAVLRMLPSRLTLREIADELFISINTLKFHLKVIYRKLGCSSRAEAADMARALAGLHRPAQSVQPWSTRRRWTS
jgi:LuxR family maltose regulon positive regulatory protein